MILRKKKYRFNSETLVFEEIKTGRKQRIRNFLLYIVVILSITVASGFISTYYFGSSEYRFLSKQLSGLNAQMQALFVKAHSYSLSLRNGLFRRDNDYRSILQIDTVQYSIRLAGSGGSASAGDLYKSRDITYQLNNLIDKLNQQLQLQSGSFELIYKKALEYSNQLTHLPAIQPVAQNDLIMISSHFGLRSDPFLFLDQVHYGLDFVAPLGKKVYATGDGTVTFVQYSRTGYGNEIVVDHQFGFGSRYAHLDQIFVKEREEVKRGQVIGTVGQTGRATGPHLHYEVLYEHKPVDPSFFYDTTLTREEFAQIIDKAKTRY